MSVLLAILGAISNLCEWVIGYGQRRIGRQQQENDDAKETIKKLQAEKDAAVARPDSLDELSKHKF